jgi:hypothetical protein
MSKQKYPQAATVTSTGESRKGREHYSHAKADARKNKRRDEAEDRQIEHDVLDTDDKIAKAKSRRGESKREIARLTKGLEWEKAQKVTAAAKAKQAHPAPLTEAQKGEKAVKRSKSVAANEAQKK